MNTLSQLSRRLHDCFPYSVCVPKDKSISGTKWLSLASMQKDQDLCMSSPKVRIISLWAIVGLQGLKKQVSHYNLAVTKLLHPAISSCRNVYSKSSYSLCFIKENYCLNTGTFSVLFNFLRFLPIRWNYRRPGSPGTRPHIGLINMNSAHLVSHPGSGGMPLQQLHPEGGEGAGQKALMQKLMHFCDLQN